MARDRAPKIQLDISGRVSLEGQEYEKEIYIDINIVMKTKNVTR